MTPPPPTSAPATSWAHVCDQLQGLEDEARPAAVDAQHARGKLTARERIAQLADSGSFVEIGALAAAAGPDVVPGDAVIVGSAKIDGRPVVLLVTDFTSAGGSNGLTGNEKQRRAWQLAAGRGVPVVMLFDGGGHRIHEGLDARTFAGGFDIQHVQTRLSGWVPMVAAMLGPGYGQATLAAAGCDYVVAVRGIAAIGMAPPALVRAATGEDVDVRELAGADAQASYGTVDLAVDSEDEAFDAIRAYLAMMPLNAEDEAPVWAAVAPELSAATQIDTLVPDDLRHGYDMYRVIDGLVDDGSAVELRSAFAQNIVTCLARIEGRVIGVVANQPRVQAGMLDADAADKAAHLISLCDAYAIPVLVLMDLPGLAVGLAAERAGLARSSARLALEFGSATVPTFTVVARKGFGGGYVVFSGGRTFDPDVVLAWPSAQTGVMGVQSAVDLVFGREVAAAADPDVRRRELIEQFSQQLGALRGAEGFGVDAVCLPSQTRARLADAMAVLPRRRMLQTLTPRRHPVAPV